MSPDDEAPAFLRAASTDPESIFHRLEHVPAEIRERLEADGVGADDLDPETSGIRSLRREAVPGFVATVLELTDGDPAVAVRPADGDWEVEWHAVDAAQEFVADGGRDEAADERTPDLSALAAEDWQGKARANVDEWGLQDLDTLLLAAQEELGELTTAVLEYEHEGGDASRILHELDDLAALTFQIEWAFYEAERQRDDAEFDVATDGGKHTCKACGETFDTLTRLRLHEKDDCQARATLGKIDPDSATAGVQAAEGLLTCRDCGQENPDVAVEETPSYDGEDYHLIVEFSCAHCGFDNENRVVMTGVGRSDLDDLPPHLQPDGEDLATDGGQLVAGDGPPHHCDICGGAFDTLGALADHDCRPNAGVDLSAHDVVERTGGVE